MQTAQDTLAGQLVSCGTLSKSLVLSGSLHLPEASWGRRCRGQVEGWGGLVCSECRLVSVVVAVAHIHLHLYCCLPAKVESCSLQ